MVGSASSWRLSNEEIAARNLQLTMLSYTRKGVEDPPILDPVGFAKKDCNRNEFVVNKSPAGVWNDKSREVLRSSAVFVRNGMKNYGSGNSTSQILNNFNMTVPRGTIYSLLGSSGCGKTTVLSCIVGLKNLNAGEVYVFGKKPGGKGCGVPGKMVGYMPQELGLYESMSIAEIIWFYGALASMERDEIKVRLEFLVSFLDLPSANRRIDSLSCGQRRRVSLGLTLVHSPELLILDEPTVGVDPLLRESIWQHLTSLVSTQGTTVIITTHYVEEAHRSHTVGLMRSGHLLMEDNPQKLLIEHQANSLNDIVLKLCKNDKFQESYVKSDAVHSSDFEKSQDQDLDSYSSSEDKNIFDIFTATSYTKIRALTIKNAVLMMRNLWLILLILLNPAFDICLVNVAMGGDPSNLSFGFVNNEFNTSGNCKVESFEYETCILANLSCRLINKLSQGKTFKLSEFNTDDDAQHAVDIGEIWGWLSFPNGYSDSLFERATEGLNIDNKTLEMSNVNVKMDATNRPVAAVILSEFYDCYKGFMRGLLSDCSLNPEFGDLPVKVLPPTHGSFKTDMKEFVAPGILLGVLFFFPYCSGALAVIYEKKQGTLQRTQVAGATIFELMISFLLTQTIVLIIQSFTTFYLTTWYFGIVVNGSVPLGLVMAILMGLDGVSMGFLVAAFCNGELEAVILGIGYFLANFIVSGTLWPIQAGPVLMQYFAYLFPATLPTEAVRSIISRGWGITHINVWPGFVSEMIRIAIFWILTICIHKIILSKR